MHFRRSGSKRADVLRETNSPKLFLYIYIYICQESGIKNGGRKKQQFDSLIQCEIQFDPVKRERRRIKGDIRLAKTVNRERREKNGRRRNRGYDIFDSFRFVRS